MNLAVCSNEIFKGDLDVKCVVLSYVQLLTLFQVKDFYKNLSQNKKIQQKYILCVVDSQSERTRMIVDDRHVTKYPRISYLIVSLEEIT